MKATIEWLADGLMCVTVGSERHTVLEAHFRFDGPMPVMDLTHPLGDLTSVQPAGRAKTMDDPPDED